ncbi:GNAT family N-acetyltransferase [Tropicimonas sp. TH_r6]|uniref:GNAT family N-acetyltransferase n=1 Tax=Tropicimonas sp. TH_r6 TaxID=3082085 RepID=UPI002953A8F7|nr:GNAT family N-acetyltransferase [Tropicimonas sp. TH_r6]MDV7142942.1 GNAT family N-acetyltransferase [Tropicimonas sp. TH_r6]
MTEIESGAPISRIRGATRRDAPRLLEMIAALAAHHGDRATASLRTLERDLFGPTACSQALLAERQGALAGYALLCPLPHLHFGLRIMDLHHLFVEPAYRGAGIGRHLVAATVAEARRQECGRLTVSTHADNSRAQEIYDALGFERQAPGGPRFRLELPANGALPAGWV